MNKFKVGDKVTPIKAERYGHNHIMKQLVGKTLVVSWVSLFAGNDEDDSKLVLAGIPGEVARFWHSEDLQLVPTAQPESIPPATQKPLRRGHLVNYKGKICVVISKGTDPDGDYRIASLTDTPHFFWASVDELTKIGSIRKKVNRLQAQLESIMSQFKVGDKVKVINVDRYTDRKSDQQKEMLGCTLLVRAVYYEEFTTGVFTGIPGEGVWRWHPDDLQLVSETPPEPAPAASKKPKPIRRGDLVRYKGEIWVVFSEGEDRHGDYSIASLTGESDYNWAKIDELTRIGTIRKKVKQLEAQMEDEE